MRHAPAAALNYTGMLLCLCWQGGGGWGRCAAAGPVRRTAHGGTAAAATVRVGGEEGAAAARAKRVCCGDLGLFRGAGGPCARLKLRFEGALRTLRHRAAPLAPLKKALPAVVRRVRRVRRRHGQHQQRGEARRLRLGDRVTVLALLLRGVRRGRGVRSQHAAEADRDALDHRALRRAAPPRPRSPTGSRDGAARAGTAGELRARACRSAGNIVSWLSRTTRSTGTRGTLSVKQENLCGVWCEGRDGRESEGVRYAYRGGAGRARAGQSRAGSGRPGRRSPTGGLRRSAGGGNESCEGAVGFAPRRCGSVIVTKQLGPEDWSRAQ